MEFIFCNKKFRPTYLYQMKFHRLNFLLLIFSSLVLKSEAQTPGKTGFGVTVVQEQPKFPGGDDSLISFLKNNLRYPAEAKLAKIQGLVYVGFLVDQIGKIKDVRLLNSVNKQLDDEALRVVNLMPDWIPGKAGDTPVGVEFILPIEFVMPEKK
jgi:TonB family protein